MGFIQRKYWTDKFMNRKEVVEIFIVEKKFFKELVLNDYASFNLVSSPRFSFRVKIFKGVKFFHPLPSKISIGDKCACLLW